MLTEIGRLREIAFRDAGEGTGQSVDLDRFDRYYEHIFLWHEEAGELVGAYGIGRVDLILNSFGLSGLYTHTLFQYGPGIRPLLQTSLELGRSFVRPEYQKAYAPLWLLWRGTGRYVARRRIYTPLIGPVSISYDYHVLSRHLILSVLENHCFSGKLGRWVRPRPPALQAFRALEHEASLPWIEGREPIFRLSGRSGKSETILACIASTQHQSGRHGFGLQRGSRFFQRSGHSDLGGPHPGRPEAARKNHG